MYLLALKRRAVGVVRVSRTGGREGERFVSPSDQRERIEAACERDGLELVDVMNETDVSGGAVPGEASRPAPRRRNGRSRGCGGRDGRLLRSPRPLDHCSGRSCSRVESAGGRSSRSTSGSVGADTASQWLSGTMLGAVAEYHRRATAERTAEAKRRAIARGVPPFPNVPPGYRKREDGRLEPDPDTAPVVAEAFERRANGATVMDVRAFLREKGIERSFHGVQALLGSRILLGELTFGALVNDAAHQPIVPAATFERVQNLRLPRGRRPASDRLLARLSVLRCGTCGARMVVGSTVQGEKRHWFYRCPRSATAAAGDDQRHRRGGSVVQAVQELLADVKGTRERRGRRRGCRTGAGRASGRTGRRDQDTCAGRGRGFGPRTPRANCGRPATRHATSSPISLKRQPPPSPLQPATGTASPSMSGVPSSAPPSTAPPSPPAAETIASPSRPA